MMAAAGDNEDDSDDHDNDHNIDDSSSSSSNDTSKSASYLVLRQSLVHRGLAESQVCQSPAAELTKLSQTSHQYYTTLLILIRSI